jgi:hypothetical protein
MYIEFALPIEDIWYVHQVILEQIRVWGERYSIEIVRIKPVKFTIRVFLKNQSLYEFFALTWDPEHPLPKIVEYLKDYRFVEPKIVTKSIDSR